MSKLDTALDIDLAERAEQLTKEAEHLRSEDKLAILNGTTIGYDKAVATSVDKLRKLAKR